MKDCQYVTSLVRTSVGLTRVLKCDILCNSGSIRADRRPEWAELRPKRPEGSGGRLANGQKDREMNETKSSCVQGPCRINLAEG